MELQSEEVSSFQVVVKLALEKTGFFKGWLSKLIFAG